MKLGAIKEPGILGARARGNKSEICQRFIPAVRISGAKKGNVRGGTEGTRLNRKRRETVAFALGKNVCGVHGLHGANTARYAREQFCGSMRHINRDERKRRRVTRGKKRKNEREREKRGIERVRKMGKGMCARGTRWRKTLRRVRERERAILVITSLPRGNLNCCEPNTQNFQPFSYPGQSAVLSPFLALQLPQVRAPWSSSSFFSFFSFSSSFTED